MALLSSAAVNCTGGDITIDAEALAPKLGLSIEVFKEEMAKGLVTGVVETGSEEDVGRTRLTFFYGAQVWRVVVEPGGALAEDPVPTDKLKPAKDLFSLLDLARNTS